MDMTTSLVFWGLKSGMSP